MTPSVSQQAVSAYESGRMEDAETFALAALKIQPGEPEASRVIGMVRLGQGNPDAAIEYLKAGCDVAPANGKLAHLLGAAYRQKGNPKAAFKYFQKAIEADPSDPAAWQDLGTTALSLARWSDANCAFMQCLKIEQDNVEASAGMAFLALRDKDAALALRTAHMITARHPDHLFSRHVIAEAHLLLGEHQQALEEAIAIAKHPDATESMKGIVLGIAADASDALGKYDQAFEQHLQAKAHIANEEWRYLQYLDKRGHFERLADIADIVPTLANKTKTWPEFEKGPQHVIFIGFPKSGVSVLNNVLLRHPQIVDVSGRPLSQRWMDILWSEHAAQNLASLEYEDLVALRAESEESLEKAGFLLPEGSVAYQFLPFYSQYMAGLMMVQPTAKIIFMHRDPRDVVLSCFKQRFAARISMYEFLKLETTTRFYDLVMGVVHAVRENFDVDLIELSFDDVFDDIEGEARRVIKFLGMEWQDGLVLDEDRVVNRELQDGRRVRGWHNYEAHLAPVRPVLDKWAERFGYG